MKKSILFSLASLIAFGGVLHSCKPKKTGQIAVDDDAAKQVYVAPGHYDEYYDFVSGGFSGQVAVYGIPSGRLLKVIPVFSQNGENGYGYDENTKPMLNTSFGFVPWDDSHHTQLSETDAMYDASTSRASVRQKSSNCRIRAATMLRRSSPATQSTSWQVPASASQPTTRTVTCPSRTTRRSSADTFLI